MAAIHASALFSNAEARIGNYLQANWEQVTGAPELVFRGQLAPPDRAPFVQLLIEELPTETWGGKAGLTQEVYQAEALITATAWYPDGSADSPHDAYAVVKAGSTVAHLLRLMSLDFLDYSTTPESPTAVSGPRIRVIDTPQTTRIPPADGMEGRRVTATAQWFARHTLS